MFEYFISNYGSTLIGLILCTIAGCLGFMVKNIYQTYVNDERKKEIARAVVQFVEQAWKTLHGADKLNKALETAQAMLAKKGIDFDAEEMMVLIEAAVAEFNEAFKKPLEAAETQSAVLRVEEETAAE